jgi:hypothetical protein
LGTLEAHYDRARLRRRVIAGHDRRERRWACRKRPHRRAETRPVDAGEGMVGPTEATMDSEKAAIVALEECSLAQGHLTGQSAAYYGCTETG